MAYQGLVDTKSQYSYSGKSKVIYSRGLKKRSATNSRTFSNDVGPYVDGEGDTKS